MRVLVTGGAGQLAQVLPRVWPGPEWILADRAALDLGDPHSLRTAFAREAPDVLINCGAFTQVDRCESDPDQAQRINATAVGELAEACGRQGALLVQLSTDYVFDGQGTRPYCEDDATNPLSVYGRTKLQGEQAAARAPRYLILRTSWLYEAQGRNFLNTMLGAAAQGRALRVVADQRGAPTSARSLARQIRAAVEGGWQGLYHATCTGETTWHGFAQAIFEAKGLAVDLSPCTTADYPTPARRPAYSVLDGARRRTPGPDLMPSWQEALAEVLADPDLTKERP